MQAKRKKMTRSMFIAREGGCLPLKLSLTLNVILLIGLYVSIARRRGSSSSFDEAPDTTRTDGFASASASASASAGTDFVWHGGNPMMDRPGSCWCNSDPYCLCTPNFSVDLIVASGDDHVWLVRRKDNDRLATMGGFVQVGETAEHAVARELLEEMGIQTNGDGSSSSSSSSSSSTPHLFGIYSDPRRDNRRHTVSAVYAVRIPLDVHPQASDDAKDVHRLALDDIERHDFFSDHKSILLDYRRSRRSAASDADAGDAKKEDRKNDLEPLEDAETGGTHLHFRRSTCFDAKAFFQN